MITFTEIVSCNGTVIYESVKQHLSFKTSGKLEVLLSFDGMMLIKLNDFQYGINPHDQILYDNQDPQFAFIFYLKRYPQGTYIIKVNQNYDSVFSCFNEKCYLKNKRQNSYIKPETKQQYSKQQQLSISSTQNQSLASKIFIGASHGIGSGLKYTGKLLSSGFSSLGGYLSKKVKKNQDVQISESTKNNIKFGAKTTKNVLQFTATQVGNLFKFGKQLGSNVAQRFEESQKGKQLKSGKYYEGVKQGAKTGVKVISNLYDGVVTAVYQVGSGISNGASKIIGAKYGKQAEQVAEQTMEGAGNVIKIARTPYDQAAKTFKQQ